MEVVKLSQFADDWNMWLLKHVMNQLLVITIISLLMKNIIITNPEMSMLLFERSGKYITEFGK